MKGHEEEIGWLILPDEKEETEEEAVEEKNEETEEKQEPEPEEEEEPEEETEEKQEAEEVAEEELSQEEIDAVPSILCSDDFALMEIEDTDVREVEERGFLFSTNTENHLHLKYVCPECGRYYFYDMETQRQGCFIATAAYGTPFSKDINVLRRFRDSYLVHREWGEKIISMYYTLSPPIAKIIGKSEKLRKLVRTCLTPVVELFKRKYEDS